MPSPRASARPSRAPRQTAAGALAEIARATSAALGALAQVAHEHRTACAELALACARTIAGAALTRFPEAPAQAALAALAARDRGRRRGSPCAPRRKGRSGCRRRWTRRPACGFPGQIVVTGDPPVPPAAFVLDWGDGRAAFDPAGAAERVAEALPPRWRPKGCTPNP